MQCPCLHVCRLSCLLLTVAGIFSGLGAYGSMQVLFANNTQCCFLSLIFVIGRFCLSPLLRPVRFWLPLSCHSLVSAILLSHTEYAVSSSVSAVCLLRLPRVSCAFR